MRQSKIGDKTVSKLILGTNPFSGFSHQSREMDRTMMGYYKMEKIKETLAQAENQGINTVIARTDNFVLRFLMEYWDEGGKIQWFAQTCPEVGPQPMCVKRAIKGLATACHVHGGWMDWLYYQNKLEDSIPIVEQIKEAGMLAGVAGHEPPVIEWALENLPVDYFMCSYYNPFPRDISPEHISGQDEVYLDKDRNRMIELISRIDRPVIHYKVMAAGRNNPADAFAFTSAQMRENDAVCVGVYTAEIPDMIAQNVKLLEDALSAAGK